MKERGIYTGPSEESFKDEKQIKREAYLRGEFPIIHDTPLAEEKDSSYWFNVFKERQKIIKEVDQRENHIKVTIPADIAGLVLIGDTHVGSQDVDYDLLQRDVELVANTPGVYALAVGDLINGYFWGGMSQMEDLEQVPRQIRFMRSVLKKLSTDNSLIAGWIGDHDGWVRKTGMNPYDRLSEELGAHYMEGIGYVTMNVGEQVYRLTGAHKLRGSSIYNDAHAAVRNTREVDNSDIIFSAHYHGKKAHLEQVKKEHGGGGRTFHAIQLGTYDRSSAYGRKQGYGDLPDESLGACMLILHGKDEKRIDYFKSVEYGIRELVK